MLHYDPDGAPCLDRQMWYLTSNFGHKNPRLNERQTDTLPQLACQYLHKEKIELAEAVCRGMGKRCGAG